MGHVPKNLRSPTLKTYTVTFSNGSTRTFEGTHLLESPEGDLLIWNDRLLVTGFKRDEYLDIR
jgi:hypothetical protein